MPPIAYTGALQPKKKSELQEIAVALRISDIGTKDEIQARIKRHLELNQSVLEDDPVFTGLFGRRKRSVQPQLPPPLPTRNTPTVADLQAQEKPRYSSARRVPSLDPVRESTPVKDLRDVSTFLKHPFSPLDSTPGGESHHAVEADGEVPPTPSSLPPLPPSPAKSLVERLPQAADVSAVVEQFKSRQEIILEDVIELWVSLRTFLSNSRNIWALTVVLEFLYIISAVLPTHTYPIPLSPKGDHVFTLHYPPFSAFQARGLWLSLFHWVVPTLVIPAVVGNLISFNPSHTSVDSGFLAPFDPLTAAITRLAAQVGYPFPDTPDLIGLDVLGFKWRVLTASVGLAFSFAEAIAGAPQMFANTLVKDRRQRIALPSEADRQSPVARRALTAEPSN
ncbi:hypothetical protein BDQ17DRAFT_1424386 [Cyathus striatus]|nr:hypothetical protein BDQ17DRAFT_1424386 [Cyathus striatus]